MHKARTQYVRKSSHNYEAYICTNNCLTMKLMPTTHANAAAPVMFPAAKAVHWSALYPRNTLKQHRRTTPNTHKVSTC